MTTPSLLIFIMRSQSYGKPSIQPVFITQFHLIIQQSLDSLSVVGFKSMPQVKKTPMGNLSLSLSLFRISYVVEEVSLGDKVI